MLYELLTGRPPFLGATAMETLVQVTNHEAPPPTRLQAHIPRDLETICLKCLQKDPRRRYLSAHELAEDLRRFLSGEPILARPVSTPERLLRWCKRNPRVAALLGAVAFLLVLVASGSLWAAIRISGEKKQTELQKEIAEQNAAAERIARQEADHNATIAKKNAAEASRQAQVALGTVYDVVTTAEAKLSVRADMGPLRKELLELAMKRLDQISKDAATSGLADRTMGVALQRMGNFYGQLGKTEQQLEVYQRSLDIFNRLIVEQPKEDWNKFNAAGSYEELGEVGREIEPDPGKLFNYYNRALDLRKDLVAQIHGSNPTPFLRKRALVYTYIKLALLELTVGHPGRAQDYARNALRWSETATVEDPTKANDRWELLSVSYLVLGKASHRLGEEEEGRQSCLRAVDLRQEWVNADRDNARARQELGRAHNALGELEIESGRGQSALEHHQRARTVFEELLAKDKNNPEWHWYLANTDYYLGNVHQLLGNKTKAEEHYRKCLKTREILLKDDPNNVERKIEFMLVQAGLGQHKPASQAAAEVCKYAPKHPGKLFFAACGYARCLAAVTAGPSAAEPALARQYGEKAVEVLDQAVAQGYKDAVAIGKTPELKSLQNLPGYQRIATKLSNDR
jgi:tetratricopeptide (TPR) repeat protein